MNDRQGEVGGREYAGQTLSEWFDLSRVILWVVMTGVAYFAGWLSIVAFVSLLSLWALVESAWAAWRANEAKRLARIEAKLDRLLEILEAS